MHLSFASSVARAPAASVPHRRSTARRAPTPARAIFHLERKAASEDTDLVWDPPVAQVTLRGPQSSKRPASEDDVSHNVGGILFDEARVALTKHFQRAASLKKGSWAIITNHADPAIVGAGALILGHLDKDNSKWAAFIPSYGMIDIAESCMMSLPKGERIPLPNLRRGALRETNNTVSSGLGAGEVEAGMLLRRLHPNSRAARDQFVVAIDDPSKAQPKSVPTLPPMMHYLWKFHGEGRLGKKVTVCANEFVLEGRPVETMPWWAAMSMSNHSKVLGIAGVPALVVAWGDKAKAGKWMVWTWESGFVWVPAEDVATDAHTPISAMYREGGPSTKMPSKKMPTNAFGVFCDSNHLYAMGLRVGVPMQSLVGGFPV